MKNTFNKAQISIEYMLIIGLVFVVVIPLLYYAMRESNINVQLNQAEDAVNTLARAADTVYSIGPGTRKYVWINMPGGVQAYSTTDKTVLLKMYIFGNVSDVFAETKANLAGVIPISKGTHRIKVEMLESGYVQFGEANDTIAPIVIWTDPSGTINYNGIVIRATTNEYAVCKYDINDVDYSIMSGNFVGSALTHEKDMGILSDGNYTYFVRCQDPSGNVMEESAVINFTIVPSIIGNESLPETNETYEPYPPIISLISPENNYIDDDGIVLFEYNVTDNSSIWFCQLIINNTVDQTDFNVTRNITQNFSKTGMDYGDYSWNINCSDVHGNRNSSLIWNFSVNYTQDQDNPIVQLVSPSNNALMKTNYIEFKYNVTDITSNISSCSLQINGTLESGDPFSQTLSDNLIEENITQSFLIILNNGNYTWNVFCVDDSYYANVGYSESRNLIINASYGIGVALKDIGIDNAWYFKTNGDSLNTEDNDMASWEEITDDLLDDDINTPSTTYVIRTRGGWKYEGYVAKVNEETNSYTKIVLYGRVRIIDTSPFKLRVYPYNSDTTINTAQYAEFSIEDSILDEKVKWVELDITNIAKTEDGFGWIRARITALNNSAQDNKRFQFSELHYKVG